MKKSNFRITQVEYVIITHIDNPYQFSGDIKTIPQPIRVARGYSIVNDLRKKNVNVYELPGDLNSIKVLFRDKIGSVVTHNKIADYFINDKRFKGKLKKHIKPFSSKSYFLAFSKNNSITKKERDKIWEEIKAIRENINIMNKLLKTQILNPPKL